ncbi:MAG TPA: RagB/SusD family nutrient uptake outer membrane protein [Chitinophagaceae bacterium]|nr:RagB/SusD family nutrient uptake outer membrane protein [Chitinophagaceae bacterium]
MTGCKKNYIDPSRIPAENAFASARGMTGVVVGLQRTYSVSRLGCIYNSIAINGLLTNELFVPSVGNAAELQLQEGGSKVDAAHTMLTTYWKTINKIIYDANLVIANAPKLTDKNYASGLVAYASIFKALCIGNLAMYWEKIPDTTGANAQFISRIDGFKKAVWVLDNAIKTVQADTISNNFNKAIPAGIDIKNTLLALKARYALFAGDYTTARTAAEAVSLTTRSVFNFEAGFPNPIFENVNNKIVQSKDDTLGLPNGLYPSATDKRVPFYVSTNTTAPRFVVAGFGTANTAPIPVYLPGEMMLIKAESYARQDRLTEALNELNNVVTKKPAMDIYGIGADQVALIGPLAKQKILDEIYRNRCIELYMSGLKLEDMRVDRFNRSESERKRNFMPYPFAESDNNPNTPNNPAF